MNGNKHTDSTQFQQWSERFGRLPHEAQSAIAESLLGRSLELYINSTERCNFRCTYCYEDFAIGRMKPETIEQVKRFIERNIKGRQRLYLNWFGGEPLIASDVVIEISTFARDLCDSLGVELIGGVTTNGYVLGVELMEQLLQCKQKHFQVTLDGEQEAHDAVRRRADGKGTFKEIWSNLLALRRSDLDFSILLRLHVRPHQQDSVGRLVDKINVELAADQRFKVGFHALQNLGGPTAGTFDVLSNAEYDSISAKLLAAHNSGLNIEKMEGEVSGEACGAHVCYACKSNAFTIRADGRIGKCTVAVDQEYNVVGRLSDDGRVEISEAKHKKWTVGLHTLDPEHLACPLRLGAKHFQS